MNFIKIFIIGFLVLLLGQSCANRAAGPTGGPKDTIPPVVVRSVPVNGIVNYSKKDFQIFFNENITLDKVADNVIISPPQLTQPVLRANARVLTVSLQDELMDSTTYSVFFGNAIVDLNEKNPLSDFTFSFATGPEIDTLQVAGRLIDASTLNPMPNVVVGLHRNLSDSAILKHKFVSITKTNDEGYFTVRNVRAGQYKLYALGDTNRDFTYQPGESIAFHDSIISPFVEMSERIDTLMRDSVTIDTVIISRTVQYSPDNIILRLFKEDKKRQYLLRSERLDKYRFSLYFNDKQAEYPLITPINFILDKALLLQSNERKDSITFWIQDSINFSMDTLIVQLDYLKSDSLMQLVPATDTITLALRRQRNVAASRPGTVTSEADGELLTLQNNIIGSFDLYNPVLITAGEPVDTVLLSHISLMEKVDTVWQTVNYEWKVLDDIRMRFALEHPWKPESQYELLIDTAAFVSIYGKSSKATKSNFKIKSLEDYSSLRIVLAKYDSLAVIQVLDARENVIQSLRAQPKGVLFEYLKPGDYYVRLFIDENMNGQWDPGNVVLRRQPEPVYYFLKKMSLRANWELEETFDHLSPDVMYRKPDELMPARKK